MKPSYFTPFKIFTPTPISENFLPWLFLILTLYYFKCLLKLGFISWLANSLGNGGGGGGLVTKSCPTVLWPHRLYSQAPLSMGFSRQEYWSGLPFSSPRDLPNQGSKPCLLYLQHWQADSLPDPLQGIIPTQGSKPRLLHLLYLFSCITGRFFTTEPPGKSSSLGIEDLFV